MGQFPAYAYAISKNNDNNVQDIALYAKPIKSTTEKLGNEVVLRIPLKQVVSASICNNILTINFISSTLNATITISNELTGEIEYTEVCNAGSTTIDLSTFVEKSNNNTISISTSSWERYGDEHWDYPDPRCAKAPRDISEKYTFNY